MATDNSSALMGTNTDPTTSQVKVSLNPNAYTTSVANSGNVGQQAAAQSQVTVGAPQGNQGGNALGNIQNAYSIGKNLFGSGSSALNQLSLIHI